MGQLVEVNDGVYDNADGENCILYIVHSDNKLLTLSYKRIE